MCSNYSLIKACTNIFDDRAVIQYIERPYMTCNLQVIHVCMYKMAHLIETVIRAWSINWPILAHIQLQMRKQTSPIVEQFFVR